MKVKYIEKEATPDSINWGNNDNPNGILNTNQEYEINKIEIHTWPTHLILKEFPNKKFNSVWFTWGKNSKFNEFPKELITDSTKLNNSYSNSYHSNIKEEK